MVVVFHLYDSSFLQKNHLMLANSSNAFSTSAAIASLAAADSS